MEALSDVCQSVSGGFQRVMAAFLNQPGLPFASVLSAERVERIFARHKNLFAMGRVYSTVNVLWAFLGQVLRDGKEAACQAAVAAITVQRLADGLVTADVRHGRLLQGTREAVGGRAARTDRRDRGRTGRAGRSPVVVERVALEARRWFYLHDAGHAREPGGVPAVPLVEEGGRIADRAGLGHSVAGHGGRIGGGHRTVFR